MAVPWRPLLLLAAFSPLSSASSPMGRPGEVSQAPALGERGRTAGERRRGKEAYGGEECQEKSTEGADYTGTVNMTEEGVACQAWTAQEPHASLKPHYGDHNYCRNLDGYSGGVWCYTTDPGKRWAFCPVPYCKDPTVRVFTVLSEWPITMQNKVLDQLSITKEWTTKPQSFTLCMAFMVDAVLKGIEAFHPLYIQAGIGWTWIRIFVDPTAEGDDTVFEVTLSGITLRGYTGVLFPLQWTMVCISLDIDSAMLRLVVDGRVLGEAGYKAEEDDVWKILGMNSNLTLSMSTGATNNWNGRVSNLNMFSSALSLERMVGLTSAGGEECGAPGDFISWEEAKVTHLPGRMQDVDLREGACSRRSELNYFNAEFLRNKDCMEHCQKIGDGRSPPVVTLQQWDTLRSELNAIGNKSKSFWVAATEGDVEMTLNRPDHWPESVEVNETVWRDYYTGERLEDYAKPWESRGESQYGEVYNCVYGIGTGDQRGTETKDIWREYPCTFPNMPAIPHCV